MGTRELTPRLYQLYQRSLYKILQNSSFGLVLDPFHHTSLPINTQVLHYVFPPATKKVKKNYRSFPLHCDNGGTQVKGVIFDQSCSPLLAESNLILFIAAPFAYQLTIGISDATNYFQNSLKASNECYIINCPPHYITWFKFRLPNIFIEKTPDGQYVMEIYHGMQGTKPESDNGTLSSNCSSSC